MGRWWPGPLLESSVRRPQILVGPSGEQSPMSSSSSRARLGNNLRNRNSSCRGQHLLDEQEGFTRRPAPEAAPPLDTNQEPTTHARVWAKVHQSSNHYAALSQPPTTTPTAGFARGDATLCRSLPVTWVAVYSEHIGNTFGPTTRQRSNHVRSTSGFSSRFPVYGQLRSAGGSRSSSTLAVMSAATSTGWLIVR